MAVQNPCRATHVGACGRSRQPDAVSPAMMRMKVGGRFPYRRQTRHGDPAHLPRHSGGEGGQPRHLMPCLST